MEMIIWWMMPEKPARGRGGWGGGGTEREDAQNAQIGEAQGAHEDGNVSDLALSTVP